MCEVRVCYWNDKRKSYRDSISHHSGRKNNRTVVRGSLDLSNEKGECSERYMKLFSFLLHLVVVLFDWRATALTSKCTQSLWEIAACDRLWCRPISWDKAGRDCERLGSMSHYGECRAAAANAAGVGCLRLWLSGNAAQQSLNRFPPTLVE